MAYQPPRGDELQPRYTWDYSEWGRKYQSPRGDELQLYLMGLIAM